MKTVRNISKPLSEGDKHCKCYGNHELSALKHRRKINQIAVKLSKHEEFFAYAYNVDNILFLYSIVFYSMHSRSAIFYFFDPIKTSSKRSIIIQLKYFMVYLYMLLLVLMGQFIFYFPS